MSDHTSVVPAPAAPPARPSTPPSAPRPHWYKMAVACGIFLSLLGWLGGSESGFSALCSGLPHLTAGRLQISGPGGRLLGDWRLQSLRWQDAKLDVEIEQLAVAWWPSELAHGEALFERVEVASLRIFSVQSTEPPAMPASLQLPLALRIKQLAVGRVLFGKNMTYGKVPQLLVEGIEAGLASDGRTHRLDRLRAQVGKLALSADATLAGEQPFALTAQGALTGAAHGQPFALTLHGSGSLDQIQVDGEILTGAATKKAGELAGASGELHARLTPFSAQPLASLRLQLKGIDPSAIAASAPRALLDVEALIESIPAAPGVSAASGSLRVINRRGGALDRQVLPVESMQARINWQGERLAFDKLALALTGGGSLKGKGSFRGGQLELDLVAQGIDARALHGSLLPTRLAGLLRASFSEDKQTLELDLRDALYALGARVCINRDAVELTSVRLARGDASLSGQGRLALSGEERFTAQGSLQNFNPARFLQQKNGVPRSVLNAGFEMKGALRPALELALHFDLHDSLIGTQKLTGKGDIDLLGKQLRKINVDLEAAGNRLTTQGAFGRSGDTLRLTLLAPKLEALGFAGIAGEASANFVLSGSIASPEISGELQAPRLRLVSLLDLQGLSLNAQLGSGAQGALSGLLRCAACALPAYGVPALALEVKADGLRNRHHLSARVNLPDMRELRLALDGGLQVEAAGKSSEATGAFWSGTLSDLRAGKVGPANAPPLLQLAAPAALHIGGATTSFGPASIDGLIGKLRIERLRGENGHWQSAGRLQQFRPDTLLGDFPSLRAWLDALGRDNPQPLSIGGLWDFALGNPADARPAGRAEVWRESGDLRLGSLPLGLSDARLQATLSGGRLTMGGQLRGTRLGDISAELNAIAASGGVSALIDAQAPWQGRLQARIPDLGWLAPLLGEGFQLAGELKGEMRMAGSAARPQLSGEWRGEQLALRALDQGMRLERGQALVDITPERLLLRRLSFESDFHPLPRALKLDENIDATRLTGTPGRFEASGELALNGTTLGNAARLSLNLDRVGVIQRPDQWVAISGDGDLRIGESALDVGGKLRVDAGLWSLAAAGRPRLSDDVVIRQALSEHRASPIRRALKLDIEAALGRSFHFRGAGIESRLAGQLRIRSDDAGLPRATGSIGTADGRFDAYGQKLGIERGIINFQGAIDNPGLNILAVRKNLPVEAGVEVTGTAQRPLIRLVSTPVVPDTEKLSWLVLGRSPEQQDGGDGSLLVAAAQTIFGGQDGGALNKLQQGLGIDEFGVNSGQIGGASRLPTSRVASANGFGSDQSMNGQIVSVGKRLSSNALLSYEQALNSTESIVKLTVNLTRQFSVIARAGSESALDFFWNYSFGR